MDEKLKKARECAGRRYDEIVSRGLDKPITRGSSWGISQDTTLTGREWLAFDVINNSRYIQKKVFREEYEQECKEYVRIILERNPEIRAPSTEEVEEFDFQEHAYRRFYLTHHAFQAIGHRDWLCGLAKKLIRE